MSLWMDFGRIGLCRRDWAVKGKSNKRNVRFFGRHHLGARTTSARTMWLILYDNERVLPITTFRGFATSPVREITVLVHLSLNPSLEI